MRSLADNLLINQRRSLYLPSAADRFVHRNRQNKPMSSSTSSTDRAARPEPVSVPSTSSERPYSPRPDQISTESAAFLHAELQRQPEVRPEVVKRAGALAADPNYPPRDVIQSVAQQILNSPDLSEDES